LAAEEAGEVDTEMLSTWTRDLDAVGHLISQLAGLHRPPAKLHTVARDCHLTYLDDDAIFLCAYTREGVRPLSSTATRAPHPV